MAELNILCLVKQTFTTEARIQLDDQGAVSDKGIKMVVNPYDEYAVEKAIQMKEAGGGKVQVLTIGPDKALEAMRHCLAMGADEGARVWSDELAGADPAATAAVLCAAMKKLEYDLVLAGKSAVDDQSFEVPGRLAEMMGLPLVNAITAIEVGDGAVTVERETDAGKETIEVALPAILTAEKGLAEPRYPTLPNIMKAKRKPVQVWGLSDVDLAADGVKPAVEVLGVSLPPARAGAKMIQGTSQECVQELVRCLREEAKVL